MTARAIKQTITELAEIDAAIESTPLGALTLDPDRQRATPLRDLVDRLANSSQEQHLAAAARALAQAQLQAFPENLFWDFDYYLASIHAEASEAADYGAQLEKFTEITVGLMHLYGQRSKIRFRYVHDFIYGFDWARWVRRNPDTRTGTSPFLAWVLAAERDAGSRHSPLDRFGRRDLPETCRRWTPQSVSLLA